ncbi:hypothetical protein Esti_002525 [Eimeria stiedai]
MEQGWSGTSLQGLKINGWLEGEARCVLPDGTVYEGQFKGGNFHGKGSLIYPGEGRYEAEWQEGRAISGRFLFSDGLLYQIHDWSYLASNDRRLVGEVRGGFNAQQALHVRASDVPAGTYDAGSSPSRSSEVACGSHIAYVSQ